MFEGKLVPALNRNFLAIVYVHFMTENYALFYFSMKNLNSGAGLTMAVCVYCIATSTRALTRLQPE